MSPAKRTGYSSYIDTYINLRTTKRIVMPPVPKRPLRFQLRSIVKRELLGTDVPYWLVIHRAGIYRRTVGEDPLEARAMPHSLVPGYLPERILYAALVNIVHFIPEVDFLYQSSQDGGRLELGGLVADFLFPNLRVVLNPIGPTHYQYRNIKKDEEQIQIFAEMGYQVYLIEEDVIYDEYKLEEFLRRVFGGMGSGGGDSGVGTEGITTTQEIVFNQYDDLLHELMVLHGELRDAFGVYSWQP